MKKIILVLAVVSLFISCESNNKKVLQSANGRINHVLIVMKNSDWQGEVGDELRKIIAEPVLGLPQPEAQFEVSQVPPDSFTNLFKASRNILEVIVADENSISTGSDVYASPQKIISIKGKNKEALIEEIKKNSKAIVEGFRSSDLLSVQKTVTKKHWNINNIQTFKKQGFSIKIPTNYRKVDDNGEFLWYRNHLDGGNSIELICYTIPISTPADEEGVNIVKYRDSIGKKFIPGPAEGSYMITEEAYTPHVFEINLDNKKTFEAKGKWEVKGVYMAGPFLSYSIIDKKNNRIVVVEGLTFAPAVNKRDYMFEIEAILKTVKIN